MKRTLPAFTMAILLIFFLASCGAGGGLFTQGLGRSIPSSSVPEGSRVAENEEIPIFVDADQINGTVDLVLVELRDNLGRLISDTSYEGTQLTFPDLPPLLLGGLSEGIYVLSIELFDSGESLGTQESWFYYYDREISLKQITVNPHSAGPGQSVSVSIELDDELARSPYLQFRLNGMVVYEGSVDGRTLRFDLDAPERGGVYDLRLDIYPWFDSRIDNDTYSDNYHTLELLVITEGDLSPEDDVRIDARPGLRIDEDLLPAALGRVAARLTLNADFAALDQTEQLFAIASSGLALQVDADSMGAEILLSRDGGSYLFDADFEGEALGTQMIIDLLEGETHLTVIVTEGDRIVAGDVIDYRDFTPEADGESEDFLPGLSIVSPELDNLVIGSIRSADRLESLFSLILRKKYGNFVLYAEGFEFASAVNPGISYSEEAYVDGGYLNLPPGSWVELPDFALDDYLVEIQTRFHVDDELEASSLALLQEDGEQFREIFTLAGDGTLSSAGIPQGYLDGIPAELSFELNRRDGSVYLGLDGEEYFLPSRNDGRFRFLISQGATAELRIRLDSVSAANAPEEFVDKVLESLP
jgi:hypothetical protein